MDHVRDAGQTTSTKVFRMASPENMSQCLGMLLALTKDTLDSTSLPSPGDALKSLLLTTYRVRWIRLYSVTLTRCSFP